MGTDRRMPDMRRGVEDTDRHAVGPYERDGCPVVCLACPVPSPFANPGEGTASLGPGHGMTQVDRPIRGRRPLPELTGARLRYARGLMFMFRLKRLPGSYRSLTWTRRS